MAKSIKVTLGDQEYEIQRLNIAQLEEVQEAFQGPPVKAPFTVLRVALKRATPKAFLDEIAPDLDQMKNAVEEILKLSGLATEKKDANPPKGETSETS